MADDTSVAVLSDDQALEEVIECLSVHIPFPMQGVCTSRTLFEILVRAASQCDSIEQTCKSLEDVPGGNDIRYHLEKADDLPTLERQLNMAFHSRMPPRIRRGKQKVAMDLNLLPYYGTPSEEEKPYINRSQAKAGTCSFYAYATAYVICKGKRVTVAIHAVRREETKVSILTHLLDQLADLHLTIQRLYLDRGFFCVPVIRWLQACDIPWVMPVILRGKQGGTRALVNEQRTYTTHHTLHSPDYGHVTFEAWVIGTYTLDPNGARRIEYHAFAVYKIPLRLRALPQDYRHRFGIEASYRLKNQGRIRTTTKNPVLRLLYVGIAFVLIDLWVYLIWTYVSQPRKGGRLLYPQLFPFKTMLRFLRQAIDRRHPPNHAIYLNNSPL